jgi:hypothetical protein
LLGCIVGKLFDGLADVGEFAWYWVRKEEREALRKGYTSVSLKGKDVKKVGLYTLWPYVFGHSALASIFVVYGTAKSMRTIEMTLLTLISPVL